jgi:hypothetical protein
MTVTGEMSLTPIGSEIEAVMRDRGREPDAHVWCVVSDIPSAVLAHFQAQGPPRHAGYAPDIRRR